MRAWLSSNVSISPTFTPQLVPKQITRIRVDPMLRDRFLSQFPGSGSLSWVLETAMKELLDLSAGAPDATTLVRASMRSALARERRHRKELDSSNTQIQAVAAGLASARIEPID